MQGTKIPRWTANKSSSKVQVKLKYGRNNDDYIGQHPFCQVSTSCFSLIFGVFYLISDIMTFWFQVKAVCTSQKLLFRQFFQSMMQCTLCCREERYPCTPLCVGFR